MHKNKILRKSKLLIYLFCIIILFSPIFILSMNLHNLMNHLYGVEKEFNNEIVEVPKPSATWDVPYL